jgi:hypothetical protein
MKKSQNVKLILSNYYNQCYQKNIIIFREIKNNIIISRLPDANTKQFVTTYSIDYNKNNDYDKAKYIKLYY